MNWFGDSPLKAHVMYASPDWVADRGGKFDPARLAALLAEAGITALELYCKDIHGTTYHPTEYGIGDPYPRDVLGELLSAAHEAGMRFIAYHSIGWDRRAGEQHPDWLMRTSDGRIPFAEIQDELQLPWMCINTPYRALALARIDEVLTRYDIDGFFIDIFMDNIPTACFCPACKARFAERCGRPLPEDLTAPADIAAVREFQADSYREFLSAIRSTIRAKRPEVLLTFNFVGGISAHSSSFSDLVDWHEVESHAPDFLHQSRTAKILRAMGKPFEIMSPGCSKSIREGRPEILEVMGDWMSMVPKPLAAMKLEASIALAHTGTLTLSINPRPDGSLDPAEADSFLELGRWIRDRADSFASVGPVSDVALLWNEASYVASPLELMDRVELLSGDRSTQGVHLAMVGDHLQFDIVRAEDADLRAYQAVVLPESFVTDEETEDRLRRYVAQGGTLVALARASLVDGLGAPRRDFGLADVIGVAFEEERDEQTFYVRVDDRELGRDLPDIALMMRGSVVATRPTTASPLAHLVSQLAPRTRREYLWPTAYNPPGEDSTLPLITTNRFGDGTCLYVSFPLGTNAAQRAQLDPTPRRLLANILRLATKRRFLETNAPLLVQVVANRTSDGGAAIHFVNCYSGVDGYYSLGDPLPGIAELSVEIDAARIPQAFKVTDGFGTTLPSHLDAQTGRVRIDLPVLRDHLAVRVHPTL